MIFRIAPIAAAAVLVTTLGPAPRASTLQPWPGVAEVMRPIKGAIAEINADDARGLSSYFASDAIVVDDLAPFSWRGPDASSHWLADRDDYNALGRITNWRAIAHDPMTISIEKNATAYAVVPVTVSADFHGTLVRRTRFLTLALQHTEGAWKITSASWLTQIQKPK